MQRCRKGHERKHSLKFAYWANVRTFVNLEQVIFPSHPHFFYGNVSCKNITIWLNLVSWKSSIRCTILQFQDCIKISFGRHTKGESEDHWQRKQVSGKYGQSVASINRLSRVFFFLPFPFCYLFNARYSCAITNFILVLDSRNGVTSVASSISLKVKRNLNAPKQSKIPKQRLIFACTPCFNCIFSKNRRKKGILCEFFLSLFLPKERLVNQPVKFIYRFWALKKPAHTIDQTCKTCFN